jgi:predicted ATPase
VFKRIEAKGYRCLKEVSQELRPFEILVGSNASGKTTFFDVVGFLSDFISDGLEAAVERRTANFHDLVWGRKGNTFELALRAALPLDKRSASNSFQPFPQPGSRLEPSPELDEVHYELRVELNLATDSLSVAHESVQLRSSVPVFASELPTIDRWGNDVTLRDELSLSETRQQQHNLQTSLSSLPSDARQPGTAWLRDEIKYNVQTVALEARDLTAPSPPGARTARKNTGAGLARQVDHLKGYDRFSDWLAHVRTALPDICTIDSVLREEDRHRYVVVEYKGGVRVPSWMLSEGTLRLLALTILAYLPDFRGVYLIEEPENGVHPTALETIYQSLSSIYEAQVLVASHSPVLLSMAKPEQILCFSKTSEGTKIVRGSEHPVLKEWQGEVSLGTLAASGILG